MRFFIIGSNSFSGASFVKFLLDKNIETVGISRSVENHPVFLPYKWGEYSDYSFYQLDLNTDLEKIIMLVKSFKPTHIVNFASQSMVAQSWETPEHWYQTNVVSTIKLHDELRRIDTIEKYVHISTPEVYGDTSGVVTENTEYHPSTPYAVSRACADMSLLTFYKAYDFPVVFTRAANVYGPGQQLYRIIPRAVLFFLTHRKLSLHGGGESVRSFIHIDDVSKGTFQAALDGEPPEIFHFSTKEFVSIRSLVEQIAERTDTDFSKWVEVSGERLGKDSRYTLDCSKAEQKFGWMPEISLEKGLQETIDWVKENLDILKTMPMDYQHKA